MKESAVVRSLVIPKSPEGASQRSAITNGRRLLVGVDLRSAWGRRFKDLVAAHVDDLGGASVISTAELSLVRRAATIEVELELLEARFATAGQASNDALDVYQRTAGNLRRILDGIGLKRREPQALTLRDFLEAGGD
jgi:hypothetical protein